MGKRSGFTVASASSDSTRSNCWRVISCVNSTRLRYCEIWRHLPVIASSPCVANVGGNTASASTISGASVLSGGKETHTMLKSSTTTKKRPAARRSRRLPPIHPGEVLREDFMLPLDLSMNALALALRVPVPRIAEIVHERRSITPDTALRLARYFETSARFWLNLQSLYDLELAEDRLAHEIAQHVQPLRPKRS